MNSTLFIEILGALGGYEFVKWLVTYITHRKHEKQLKETEVDKAKSDVGKSKVAEEKALRDMYEETITDLRKEFQERITDVRRDSQERIKDLQQANTELSKQNLELLKAGAKKDEIIEDKVAKIRELNELLVGETRKSGKLEKAVQYYESWKCFREYGRGGEKCPRRKPEQNPPLKFKPLEEQ